MKLCSKVITLVIIITAMMILQAGAQESSISTVSSPSGQTGAYFANGAGSLGGLAEFNIADGKEERVVASKSRIDQRSKTASITDDEESAASTVTNADEEEEGHGSEAGEEAPSGGFDRQWDVVSNG